MRVAIAGGGIGGLTAALCCRRHGFAVSLYEQAADPAHSGAGLQLSPNAVRVLHALGLAQPLAAIASRPQAAELRHWRSARLIARLPLGEAAVSRWRAPYYHVHRGELEALLLTAARAAGVEVVLGSRVDDHDDCGAGVELNLAGGGRVVADVLVGADGIRSAVRQRLLGPVHAAFTGNVAWRALLPRERVPLRLLEPTATVRIGPRRHFVQYPVSGGRWLNYVAVVATDEWKEESWVTRADHTELRAAFEGWHDDVHTLIDASEHCYKWALFARDPLPQWSRGRVTLLGDACHPMLPFLAQGAGMAIEDAWVLAGELRRTPGDVPAALVRYQQQRLARTSRVQARSRAQGQLYHFAPRWLGGLRDLALTIGSRLTPAPALRRFDWLYGHDVTREEYQVQ